MSELITLARPYAEAVYKRAKETDSTEKWSGMLKFLALVMQDKNLAWGAENPKLKRADFLNLLLGICEGQLDEEGKNFAKLLVQNRRLRLIGQISELFERYRAEDEGYVEIEVVTAFPFSDRNKKNFSKALKKNFHKEVHLHVHEDPGLIGGVLIRAGDKVIDGSIRGQLQRMTKRLYS